MFEADWPAAKVRTALFSWPTHNLQTEPVDVVAFVAVTWNLLGGEDSKSPLPNGVSEIGSVAARLMLKSGDRAFTGGHRNARVAGPVTSSSFAFLGASREPRSQILCSSSVPGCHKDLLEQPSGPSTKDSVV